MTFLVNSTYFSYIPWQERRVYYLHRYKARRYPSKYVANIADGMDQHTTNVPSVRRITKAMSALTTVEHTLLVPLFTMDKHKMERRFMGHLTTTSILMTLISLWQFCWKSLWDGRKILTYHPFSICSLTTVLVKTWTATCLLCWHFWSKRKVLRKYVILVNFKKKWICLIHISHKALFSSIKMSHCNVFKVHLGGKLVSIQSQFLQQLNELNLKLK